VVVKDRIYKDILAWEVNFPSEFNIEVDAYVEQNEEADVVYNVHWIVTGTSNETSQSVTINHIYQWNGTDWTDIVAEEGWFIF